MNTQWFLTAATNTAVRGPPCPTHKHIDHLAAGLILLVQSYEHKTRLDQAPHTCPPVSQPLVWVALQQGVDEVLAFWAHVLWVIRPRDGSVQDVVKDLFRGARVEGGDACESVCMYVCVCVCARVCVRASAGVWDFANCTV